MNNTDYNALKRKMEESEQTIPTDTTNFGHSFNNTKHPPLLITPEEIEEFRPILLKDFLTMEFPEREMLLAPFLPQQGLVMIHAPRGVGKTFMASQIGLTVATGGKFLKWQAPKAHPVLYLDGEMPGNLMQQRLIRLTDSSSLDNIPFYFITPDCYRDSFPDLATPKAQARIEHYIKEWGIRLVVIDNLSTLVRSGKENEAEGWSIMQEWLLKLRRHGTSALIVHHTGKNGFQRGTSKREDILDTVISLKHPQDYVAQQGARFEVHFEKNRGFTGEDASPFEVTIAENNGCYVWTHKDLEESTMARVIKLHEDGLKQRDIAHELKLGLGTVNGYLKKAKTEGLIDAEKK